MVKQERWKAKKKAFLAAIKLIDRHLASAAWTGPQVPSVYVPVKEKPSGTEINDVLLQLILISDDKEVPRRFSSFFYKEYQSSPQTRGEFILRLRNELFARKIKMEPGEIPYFF